MKETRSKAKTRDFPGGPVIVEGAGFRFLAFRDNKGQLRNFWTQTLVPMPVQILDEEN